MSQRRSDWELFAKEVAEHITNYTVPQYGDKGEDPMTNYTAKELIQQVEKYCKRFGKNVRPGQQRLDLLKAAHCLQMAADKLEEHNDPS